MHVLVELLLHGQVALASPSHAQHNPLFNWLTLVLLVPLVDDSAWNALCKSAEVAERREVAAAAHPRACTRARLLVSVRFAAMRMRCARVGAPG